MGSHRRLPTLRLWLPGPLPRQAPRFALRDFGNLSSGLSPVPLPGVNWNAVISFIATAP